MGDQGLTVAPEANGRPRRRVETEARQSRRRGAGAFCGQGPQGLGGGPGKVGRGSGGGRQPVQPGLDEVGVDPNKKKYIKY